MTSASFSQHFEARLSSSLAGLQKLPLAFWRNLVIACCLLWVVDNFARAVWLLIPEPNIPRPATIVAQELDATASVSNYRVDIDALKTRQIFGDFAAGAEPVEEAQVEPVVEDDVDKTSLNLKLVGLFASSEKKLASAVIASGSAQKIYQIDEKLPAGQNVKLAKVLHDRVILSNNGKFEALYLYSEADFKTSSRTAYNVPTQSRNQQGQDEEEQEPRIDEEEQEPRIEARVAEKDIPKSITDAVRFSVHRQGGEMVGFRVRPGKKREFFDSLGLQAGDIVLSVNGLRLDSSQAIRDNYQQLKSATSADLEILRGEENLVLSISIDAISE
jgi:general secretion pathway protein C